MVVLWGGRFLEAKISPLGGILKNPGVLSSGARDLPPICCYRFGLVFIAPVLRQVLPSRIHGFDELYLLAAPPAFDFLFAGDGGIGIKKAFVVDGKGQGGAAGACRDGL